MISKPSRAETIATTIKNKFKKEKTHHTKCCSHATAYNKYVQVQVHDRVEYVVDLRLRSWSLLNLCMRMGSSLSTGARGSYKASASHRSTFRRWRGSKQTLLCQCEP